MGGANARHQQIRRRGGHHAIVPPLEQRHANHRLDPGQRLGQRRLGQVHRLRGSAHRAEIGDFHHSREVTQVQVPDFHRGNLSEN